MTKINFCNYYNEIIKEEEIKTLEKKIEDINKSHNINQKKFLFELYQKLYYITCENDG